MVPIQSLIPVFNGRGTYKQRSKKLQLNAEKTADGRRLASKFRVRGYPTVIILNHEEEEIGKIIGYLPANRYLKKLKSILPKI